MKFIFEIELEEKNGYSSRFSYEDQKIKEGKVDIDAYRKGLTVAINAATALGILNKDFEEELEKATDKELKRLEVIC